MPPKAVGKLKELSEWGSVMKSVTHPVYTLLLVHLPSELIWPGRLSRCQRGKEAFVAACFPQRKCSDSNMMIKNKRSTCFQACLREYLLPRAPEPQTQDWSDLLTPQQAGFGAWTWANKRKQKVLQDWSPSLTLIMVLMLTEAHLHHHIKCIKLQILHSLPSWHGSVASVSTERGRDLTGFARLWIKLYTQCFWLLAANWGRLNRNTN